MSHPTSDPGACGCDCSGVRRRKRQQHSWKSPFILVIFFFFIEAILAQPRVTVDAPVPPTLEKVSQAESVPPTAEILSRDLAPKDIGKDKDGGVGVDDSSSSKTLFFGEDLNGVPIVVGTWFRYGSYTLAFSMFGTAFLMSCMAAAVYYVIFVVTEPSQQIRSLRDGGQGQIGTSSWNVGKVLRALQIAYDTYESFDPYSPACQLKTLCEIQESPYFQGSVLKRVTHFLVHTDLVDTKLENAKQLRAADKIGNDPKERCQEKFGGCRFSLNKLYENYVTVMM